MRPHTSLGGPTCTAKAPQGRHSVAHRLLTRLPSSLYITARTLFSTRDGEPLWSGGPDALADPGCPAGVRIPLGVASLSFAQWHHVARSSSSPGHPLRVRGAIHGFSRSLLRLCDLPQPLYGRCPDVAPVKFLSSAAEGHHAPGVFSGRGALLPKQPYLRVRIQALTRGERVIW